jgi:ABC-type glutathione transport system ATPase component
MSELLELRDVTVDYDSPGRQVSAVRGVNLTLKAGETLGLAGESGCGKSTLAMSMLRLLPSAARVGGEILLDGEDVTTMKWGRLRAVRWTSAAIVFQGAMHALNPVRRVWQQIAEPIELHSKTQLSVAAVRKRVDELLAQVELPAAKGESYPHELSGGQKQRVMIAMALACEPRLVIADEPTTALDVIVQAQVLALMSDLVARKDIGLIMISHDLAVLASTCSRLAVMYQGSLVEEGPSASVIASPRHEHTRTLAAAFPTVGDPEARYAPATSTELPERVTSYGEELLRTSDLRVTFRGRGATTHAVKGVDLSVSRGEIVALVGQSGSGKTTLARTILGLQEPTGGQVLYGGEPVPRSSRALKEYRRKVQLVLQDPTSALNPRHSVYESIAEGLRIHKVPGDERAHVAAALEAAELRPPEEFMPLLPNQLSGGQRQRVVIAGALALEPKLLVADEPVASLDASVRGEILALLLRLRANLGLAALVITHDLGLAWNIADRVAVMYKGELVEIGPVDEVLNNPKHSYTQQLLAALPTTHPNETTTQGSETPISSG